MPTDNYKLF